MNNNALKFLFLFAVIGAVLFSRFAYPHSGILPSLSANQADLLTISGVPTPEPQPGTTLNDLNSSGAVSAAPTPEPAAQPATGTPSGYVAGESTPAFAKVGNAAPPKMTDAASLVADLENGTPLYALNPNARWPMASLTKLMTAAVALDVYRTSQTVAVTPQELAVDPEEFTLQAGGTYTVDDLLRVLLLPSSNVAAEALAQSYGRPQFLALMNRKAAEWNMTNTFYDDPSGLSAANQSTASDLLTLAQHVYADYPQILAITRVPHVTVTNLATGQKAAVNSIDNFSGRTDFVGGKTGHTDEASGNLLTIFDYGNHPLFVLVLGTADRFGDSLKLYNWVKSNYR